MPDLTSPLTNIAVRSNSRNEGGKRSNLCVGESQVSEEAMAKVAVEMEEKGISRVDNGATLVDFTKLLPGKEGKRLGVTVIR